MLGFDLGAQSLVVAVAQTKRSSYCADLKHGPALVRDATNLVVERVAKALVLTVALVVYLAQGQRGSSPWAAYS